MTETEKQQIVSLVLQALKTNSFTIEQLTAVKSLSDDMYVEISGGRKILVQDLTDAISAYINKDLEGFKKRITRFGSPSFYRRLLSGLRDIDHYGLGSSG